jgi:hypothetical protein
MEKMKACVFHGEDKIRIEKVETPRSSIPAALGLIASRIVQRQAAQWMGACVPTFHIPTHKKRPPPWQDGG